MNKDCKCKENKEDEIIVDALILIHDSLLSIGNSLDDINENLEYMKKQDKQIYKEA